jgi:protein ImuA
MASSLEARRLMAPSLAPARRSTGTGAFSSIRAVAQEAPLIEIAPLEAGDEGAALGFALAWIAAAAGDASIIWAGSQAGFSEDGAPCAEGLAQFGLPLDRLLVARGRTQTDALWATEQALTLAGAYVLCTIAPSKKPLGLTATRRLLLAAERSGAHCILLRLDRLDASAAWARWRIAAAASEGAGRELGPAAFTARLERNRAGPAGQSWRLHWAAPEQTFQEQTFQEQALQERAGQENARQGYGPDEHPLHAAEAALDGDLAAAPADRSAETRRRSAV